MKSLSLMADGFRYWGIYDENNTEQRLQDDTQLERSEVYALVSDVHVQRLKGESDILYIGKTNRTIKERIKDYLRGAQPDNHDQRIPEALNYAREHLGRVHILYKIEVEDCRQEEKRMLEKFRCEHFEEPPLNKKQGG